MGVWTGLEPARTPESGVMLPLNITRRASSYPRVPPASLVHQVLRSARFRLCRLLPSCLSRCHGRGCRSREGVVSGTSRCISRGRCALVPSVSALRGAEDLHLYFRPLPGSHRQGGRVLLTPAPLPQVIKLRPAQGHESCTSSRCVCPGGPALWRGGDSHPYLRGYEPRALLLSYPAAHPRRPSRWTTRREASPAVCRLH